LDKYKKHKTRISTHEVTISQQTIHIKKLERQLQLIIVDPLETAQEIVADNVETIVRLQEQLKEMDEYAQEGWDLSETYGLEIEILEQEVVEASSRSIQPHHFKGNTIETEDTLSPGNSTPEPYPHTSPIREVPVSGRVKEKKE